MSALRDAAERLRKAADHPKLGVRPHLAEVYRRDLKMLMDDYEQLEQYLRAYGWRRPEGEGE